MKKHSLFFVAFLLLSFFCKAQTNTLLDSYRSFQVAAASITGFSGGSITSKNTFGASLGITNMFQINKSGLYLELGAIAGYGTLTMVDNDYGKTIINNKLFRFKFPFYIDYLIPAKSNSALYPSFGVAFSPTNYDTSVEGPNAPEYDRILSGFGLAVGSAHIGFGVIINNRVISSVSYDYCINLSEYGFSGEEKILRFSVGLVF